MNIKATLSALGLAAIGMLATATTASATNSGTAYASVALNVRSGPAVQYARLDTLHQGERVQVNQCQNSWCYISQNGPDGWVSARYLTFTSATPPNPPQTYPQQTYPTPTPPGGSNYPYSGNPNLPYPGNPNSNYPTPNNPHHGGPNAGGPHTGGPYAGGAHQTPGWPHFAAPQARVCVFSGPNYTGDRACAQPGRAIPSLGANWNDRITSVRVSNGAQITLCVRRHYQGFCRTVTNSEPRLGRWLNNRVSSAQVH